MYERDAVYYPCKVLRKHNISFESKDYAFLDNVKLGVDASIKGLVMIDMQTVDPITSDNQKLIIRDIISTLTEKLPYMNGM